MPCISGWFHFRWQSLILDEHFYMNLTKYDQSLQYNMRINYVSIIKKEQAECCIWQGHLRKHSREGADHLNQSLSYISNVTRINGQRFVVNIAISCFYNSFEFVLWVLSNNYTFVVLKETFVFILSWRHLIRRLGTYILQ